MRTRLPEASGEERDRWWRAQAEQVVLDDLRERLEVGGFPFLDRYSTRDKILAEWGNRSENLGASGPPRIVLAIILAERGSLDRARELLALQVLETRNPRHPAYVRELAVQLGLGRLDG